MRIFAMRHAAVALVPNVPAESWQLTAAGVRAAGDLASRADFARVALVHHSPEPKAAGTAAALGAVLGVATAAAPDLREAAFTGGFLPDDEYARRVGGYLEGAQDPAFEDYRLAQSRVLACVQKLVAAAAGDLAFVSHGRLLAALFTALGDTPVTAAEWRRLRLPDLAVIDLGAGAVLDGFWAGRRVHADRLGWPAAGPHLRLRERGSGA